jgi:RNA polymerase sigma-70 factor (ECF subfamily)
MPDESVATRTTLLERLKDWSDSPSWQEFFDTYWKLIYSFALRSGLSETEAQDVVQETMVSVARHIPGFKYDRNLGSFKHWLLTMARWRVLDQIRKRKSFAMPIHEDNATETKTSLIHKIADPASSNIEAIWEAEWEKNLLEAAMTRIKRQLDPEKYQIFDFLVNKEWAPQKVAETFKISVNQVYIAKHRVTELIREEVGRINKGGF